MKKLKEIYNDHIQQEYVKLSSIKNFDDVDGFISYHLRPYKTHFQNMNADNRYIIFMQREDFEAIIEPHDISYKFIARTNNNSNIQGILVELKLSSQS